jgi:hypothetical protein
LGARSRRILCDKLPDGERSFGRDNSSGPLLSLDNRGPYDIATLAIFPEYVEFDAAEVLQYVMRVPAPKMPS